MTFPDVELVSRQVHGHYRIACSIVQIAVPARLDAIAQISAFGKLKLANRARRLCGHA
jgi:hypothetical protein